MLGFRDSPERKPHPNDSQTLGRPFQSRTSSFEFGTRDTRAIISEGPTPEQAASHSGRPSRVGNSRTEVVAETLLERFDRLVVYTSAASICFDPLERFPD